MNQPDFRKLIALLIINNIPKFRNSYDLGKVLAWKFGIIELVDITKSLINEDLVSSINSNGVNQYEITTEGVRYLKENYNSLHSELTKKYAQDMEFINSISNKPV